MMEAIPSNWRHLPLFIPSSFPQTIFQFHQNPHFTPSFPSFKFGDFPLYMIESRQAQNGIISDAGCGGDDGKKGFRKVKQAMLYPFRMAKKQILRPKIKRGFDGSVRYEGCGFCLPELCVSDSTNNGSPPTDPNHRKFTQEMLRVLIQNNDFYSKQSNPHLGV